MQPSFEAMPTSELKKYALAHRDEVEPLQELYRRRTPDENTTWFKVSELSTRALILNLLEKILKKKNGISAI